MCNINYSIFCDEDTDPLPRPKSRKRISTAERIRAQNFRSRPTSNFPSSVPVSPKSLVELPGKQAAPKSLMESPGKPTTPLPSPTDNVPQTDTVHVTETPAQLSITVTPDAWTNKSTSISHTSATDGRTIPCPVP